MVQWSPSDYTALGALFVALVGLFTGFILQLDRRKIKELERANRKQKRRLRLAMNAIKGYQEIEEEYAAQEGKSVQAYRKRVRKDKREFFNTEFLSPGNIEEIIQDLEND